MNEEIDFEKGVLCDGREIDVKYMKYVVGPFDSFVEWPHKEKEEQRSPSSEEVWKTNFMNKFEKRI